jgi:hypothetical protein
MCDAPVGAAGNASVGVDPTRRDMAMMMAVCGTCQALPPDVRRSRELQLARSMWPQFRWSPRRDNDPTYLRRGGPPKPRHARPGALSPPGGA